MDNIATITENFFAPFPPATTKLLKQPSRSDLCNPHLTFISRIQLTERTRLRRAMASQVNPMALVLPSSVREEVGLSIEQLLDSGREPVRQAVNWMTAIRETINW